MKIILNTIVPLLAFASTTFSHPLQPHKRAFGSTFLPSIQTLTTSVKTHTSAITTTAATYPTLSTSDQLSALASLASDASSINSLITTYTAQIPSIASGSSSSSSSSTITTIKRRDADADTQELASAVALLLAEINSSLNYAESETGRDFAVTRRQIAIVPLGTSLSALLLALDEVVDDLLAVVKEIVDGLLGGLAGALVGVTL